ncbi:predicted protein [Chaetomium globosum CBS 148.51]|uniref:Uncharacterized protein n=1 Tax=Chaetomium globosum (strain ATCC 6205 / CBS 148.51 / DSM 1962 / NBRC 6347 / NRRL 1970) TaxID=306901 RepID=Q2GXS5_CHAGB|nr:uncharacterized protein CHGG_07229 [Chaetomium globosum CBS 148.51]EAQ85976.1 predicted protein [Chaetomium globosum CBS 148.51]
MSQPVLEERSKKPGRPDYKAKLDEAADREKSPSQQQQSTGVIEKVSQYVPTVGRILGAREPDPGREPSPEKNVPGPPNRPENDAQIEEFLRDQHRSKKVVGIEEPTQV